MREAHEDRPGWFDPRVTLSGVVQIVLLLIAIVKFSGDVDKRLSILEITVKSHEELLRSNALSISALSLSSQRLTLLIEQHFQNNGTIDR